MSNEEKVAPKEKEAATGAFEKKPEKPKAAPPKQEEPAQSVEPEKAQESIELDQFAGGWQAYQEVPLQFHARPLGEGDKVPENFGKPKDLVAVRVFRGGILISESVVSKKKFAEQYTLAGEGMAMPGSFQVRINDGSAVPDRFKRDGQIMMSMLIQECERLAGEGKNPSIPGCYISQTISG